MNMPARSDLRACGVDRSSVHQQMLDWGVEKVEGQEFSFTVKKEVL
jgi:hypothetical protein